MIKIKIFFRKFVYKTVLQIWDFYPGSRILIFTHSGSWIPDLESQIQKQQQISQNWNLFYFLYDQEKNLGQISKKFVPKL